MSTTLDASAVAAIRARAEKAREFTHTIGPIIYNLRRPSDLRWRELVFGAMGQQAAMERRAVIEAVVGWVGPTVAGVDPAPEPPSAAELPLPCTPEMVELWLEERADHFEALSAALMQAIRVRNEERDAAKKASAG